MYYIDFEKTLPSAEIYKFQNSGTIPGAGTSGGGTRTNKFGINEEDFDTGSIRPINENPIMSKVNRYINDRSALRETRDAFRRFGESTPGKVLRFFIPSVDAGMAGAVIPTGFKMVGGVPKEVNIGRRVIGRDGKPLLIMDEGVYGSKKALERAAQERPSRYIPEDHRYDPEEAARIINGLRKYVHGKQFNGYKNGGAINR